MTLRTVNDAYSAAGMVFRLDRVAALPTAWHILPPLGLGSTAGGPSGDTFLRRSGAKEASLDSDTVGTYDVNLKLRSIDVQGAANNGAQAATIGNSPFAGDPNQWIPIYWQGAIGYVPWWNA
jgi:hypothetical protein